MREAAFDCHNFKYSHHHKSIAQCKVDLLDCICSVSCNLSCILGIPVLDRILLSRVVCSKMAGRGQSSSSSSPRLLVEARLVDLWLVPICDHLGSPSHMLLQVCFCGWDTVITDFFLGMSFLRAVSIYVALLVLS